MSADAIRALDAIRADMVAELAQHDRVPRSYSGHAYCICGWMDESWTWEDHVAEMLLVRGPEFAALAKERA